MSTGTTSALGLSLPLRIGGNGQFESGDQVSALMALFAAMAATNPLAVPHMPWFALEDVFSRAKRDVTGHPAIQARFNAALVKLGADGYSVSEVNLVDDGGGTRTKRFVITLVLPNGQTKYERLRD